jgi:hypothetical protein
MENWRINMIKTLTPVDIRDLLIGFAAAIELDQMRVDALPSTKFHRYYNPDSWRRWRRSHLDYIDQLLATVNAMPPAVLEEVTRLALTYEPLFVREAALDFFAEIVGGSLCEGQFETAELFFGWLILDVRRLSKEKPIVGDARSLMMQWLPATDPLGIAEDPECGYGQPAGFVS